jgi:hypothetical protein
VYRPGDRIFLVHTQPSVDDPAMVIFASEYDPLSIGRVIANYSCLDALVRTLKEEEPSGNRKF